MGHRLTADMSKAGKVKRGGNQSAKQRVLMHMQHVARSVDVDPETGKLRQHSFRNEDIDTTRTHMNEVWVNDFEGGFKSVESLGEVMDVYDRYMAGLDPDVTVRSDAVLGRGVVLALDEAWWAENNPNWRTEGLNETGRKAMDTLLDAYVDEVGQQYVMTAISHLDEHLPEWQVFVVPIVDGRLSSDKVLPSGAKAMTEFHEHMRMRMSAAGYDIELKSSGRSKERLAMPTLKKMLKSGVSPEEVSPALRLDRAITGVLDDIDITDDELFDKALQAVDVTRVVDPKTGGTLYSMPNPHYDPDAEDAEFQTPRFQRAASKLPSKPTVSVVADAFARNKAEQARLRAAEAVLVHEETPEETADRIMAEIAAEKSGPSPDEVFEQMRRNVEGSRLSEPVRVAPSAPAPVEVVETPDEKLRRDYDMEMSMLSSPTMADNVRKYTERRAARLAAQLGITDEHEQTLAQDAEVVEPEPVVEAVVEAVEPVVAPVAEEHAVEAPQRPETPYRPLFDKKGTSGHQGPSRSL